jgi:DNA-binding NarL/FixJ family response regulator
MNKTRILIIEPHPLVVMGLKQLMEQLPDMTVVDDCPKSASALQKVLEVQPDLVVIDTSAQGVDGALLTQQILKMKPDTKVIAFAGLEERSAVMEIINAGACAYVSKRSAPDEIIHALRSVVTGDYYVDGNLLRVLCPPEVDGHGGPRRKSRNELTERECSVLRRVALGYVAKEIAADLSVSQKSVETYKTRGMRKLGLSSRPEVVRYACRQGWLEELRRVSGGGSCKGENPIVAELQEQ